MNKKIISKTKGFTLIEILAVILIFSTVALIVFPSMISALSSFRLEATANKLAKDISKAKMYAIMYKKDVWIDFHIVSDGESFYEITSADHLNSDNKVYSFIPQRIAIPQEINLRGLAFNNTLRFNQHGYPFPGMTIQLTNSRGKSLYVIVAARSGRVRISNFGGNY